MYLKKLIYTVLEICKYYKIYKDMSDNTSNMEKSTKTGKEIIQEMDENHSQIIVYKEHKNY